MSIIIFGAFVIVGIVAGALVRARLVAVYDPEGREAHEREIARQRADADRVAERRAAMKRAGETAMEILPIARDRQQSIAVKLKRAGLKISPATYWAAVLTGAVTGAVIGGILVVFATSAALLARLAVLVLLVAAGAIAPRLYVSLKTSRRRMEITASLPATLEQLSIVVGAGQTIERGIKTIAQRTHGPLAEEFAQVDTDITYFGRTAPEALTAMAERCDIPSMSLFAASVSQSINAGSPIAAVLRSQAKIATESYYLDIEEQSNKIRTKMIFPTVFLILPPIFILSLGPTVLRLMEELPKLLG